jgi:homoserine dehydrogenase
VVRDALKSGKHVVTANKALLAERGQELFELAHSHGVDLAFEASVGGGIPVIRSIREALASDQILHLAGIINGTSNFILSAMTQGAESIEDVVREAQEKGFAEADPSMDVEGIDAAQKLSLLTSLAFGTQIPYTNIPTRGLMSLCPVDFALAKHFGFVLKPLAIASRESNGVYAKVTPALVPENALMASVNGAFNAVYMKGSALGPSLLYGQGAGMLPTAVSVVSDMIEVSRNILQGAHGRLPFPTSDNDQGHAQVMSVERPTFIRLKVRDTPGVLAQVAGVLAEAKFSIRQMIQTVGQEPGEAVIGLTTYPAQESVLRGMLEKMIEEEGPVLTALALPILELE